ncbi:MAG: imidazole glycerol phosphate synthase subunit HisH [Burkholderiaceae bacterium]|nr:imidazole glycerol phosphate synthase subunit HisH [Burkholderiaceae bacterium]MDH3459501.1 imidazole glycerol phosphate synthase subunit HisH [Burkholderiaceae bacterium]
MNVAIVNYGMGNLGSVRRALEDLGARALIVEHPAALFDANRIVLPGVGAFSEGMSRLQDGGWIETLQRLVSDGRPLLGICLGMQMLATSGEEGGANPGLDLVPGRVRRLDLLGCELQIPHVGWNDIVFEHPGNLFKHIPLHSNFYFVHSFAFIADSPNDVVATTDYGVPVVAAVQRQNTFGTQFHPEKSSKAGRQLLRNFLDFTPC